MFIIASNITSRDARINQTFEQLRATGWNLASEPAQMLERLARQCAAGGADAIEINLQQHGDRPEALASAVKIVQEVTDRQLCLSTNNPEALRAGLKVCKNSPMVNYISVDEIRLREMLPLVANHGAYVVLLVSNPTAPTDSWEMLHKAAVLIGAANESGIPNDHILLDPGLIHISGGVGQRHLIEIKRFLQALPDAFDPPVKSTCWIANISAGAPEHVRPVMERTLLAMLAGLGLDSAFLNVLDAENQRLFKLMKIFANETIYSDSEVEIS